MWPTVRNRLLILSVGPQPEKTCAGVSFHLGFFSTGHIYPKSPKFLLAVHVDLILINRTHGRRRNTVRYFLYKLLNWDYSFLPQKHSLPNSRLYGSVLGKSYSDAVLFKMDLFVSPSPPKFWKLRGNPLPSILLSLRPPTPQLCCESTGVLLGASRGFSRLLTTQHL